MEEFKFNTVEEAIAAIKAGKMVLVTDDEDRENEGDLIMAAELCTPEAVNFMAKYARGLICMPAAPEIMDKLQFGAMVAKNTDNHETAFSRIYRSRRYYYGYFGARTRIYDEKMC